MSESIDIKQIQNELNSETESTELPSEQTEVETEQGLNDEFGLAQIIDALLVAWAERTREGLGEKIKMNEFELKALNGALNPLIEKLLMKFGIEKDYILGIIAAVGILLPRVLTIISEGKKQEQQKEVEQNGKSINLSQK